LEEVRFKDVLILLFSCRRVEAKGKGILQRHQILAELQAIPEESRAQLLDGAFGEVLKSTQVL